MGSKNEYPESRKSAEIKSCQLCNRKMSARGLVSHLRMGHHKDIVEYYSFLQNLLQDAERNTLSEDKNAKLQSLITALEKLVKNEKLLHPDSLPSNLNKRMTEFGFKDHVNEVPVRNTDARKKTLADTPTKGETKTKADYVLEYAGLIKLRNELNDKIHTIQKQLLRYKNMPGLLDIEMKGIQIQKQKGLDTKEAEEKWNFYSALLGKSA